MSLKQMPRMLQVTWLYQTWPTGGYQRIQIYSYGPCCCVSVVHPTSRRSRVALGSQGGNKQSMASSSTCRALRAWFGRQGSQCQSMSIHANPALTHTGVKLSLLSTCPFSGLPMSIPSQPRKQQLSMMSNDKAPTMHQRTVAERPQNNPKSKLYHANAVHVRTCHKSHVGVRSARLEHGRHECTGDSARLTVRCVRA